VPTVGRNILVRADLAPDHLKWLDEVIRQGPARRTMETSTCWAFSTARLTLRGIHSKWHMTTHHSRGPRASVAALRSADAPPQRER
jgi:hypothetical protein